MKYYITRKLKNNKFIYFDKNNNEVKNKEILNKISKIYIAPAYKNVKIFPNSEDLLAYGYDEAGRKQYVYSEKFKLKREAKKYCKMIGLCSNITKLNKTVQKDLSIAHFTKNKMLAVVVKMMELCNFRCGTVKMEKIHGSHGITTIHKKHLKVKPSEIEIEFIGKKGVINHCILKNKQMVEILKKMLKLSTKNNPYLFSIKNEKGDELSIDINDVNEYLIKYGVTSKDLRTWNANIIFIKSLKKIVDKNMNEYKNIKNKYQNDKNREKKKLEKMRKSFVKEAINETALLLHHTPTICKSSYLFKSLLNSMLETENIINDLKSNIVAEDYLFKVLKRFKGSNTCK